MTRTSDIHVPCKAPRAAHLPATPGRLFFVALQTLLIWYERSRQRGRLAQLDDRLLRDIGIDRLAAMEEAAKPFWRE